MQLAKTLFSSRLRQFLRDCASRSSAPFEIHGARELGCRPGDGYVYQGCRYVHDTARDVLIREDANERMRELS